LGEFRDGFVDVDDEKNTILVVTGTIIEFNIAVDVGFDVIVDSIVSVLSAVLILVFESISFIVFIVSVVAIMSENVLVPLVNV
jgi:hypothetical protein